MAYPQKVHRKIHLGVPYTGESAAVDNCRDIHFPDNCCHKRDPNKRGWSTDHSPVPGNSDQDKAYWNNSVRDKNHFSEQNSLDPGKACRRKQNRKPVGKGDSAQDREQIVPDIRRHTHPDCTADLNIGL